MDVLKIKEEVQTIIKEDDLFLVDVIVKGNEGNQKVLVLIDGDNGITIDQCGKVSRKLGNTIEELELISSKYTLEVSSPGLDFPLTLDRQYSKNVGRELEVELDSGEKVVGELLSINAGKISMKAKDEVNEYSLENIKQSKVKISFK